jgi:uncharacterized protein (TIGR02145 family)/uncharacterized repeat protein (TIGR02543 family)
MVRPLTVRVIGFYYLPVAVSLILTCAVPQMPQAPIFFPIAELAYSANPGEYRVGAAIAPNIPSYTGDKADSFAINQALPAGLYFDKSTGIISGKPEAASPRNSYRIIGCNPSGKDTVDLAITVLDTAGSALRIVTDLPVKRQVVIGDSISLILVASAGQPLTYKWYKNGHVDQNQTASMYHIQSAAAADSGAILYCVVADSSDSLTSKSCTLSVTRQAVAPSIDSIVPLQAQKHEGDSVSFAVAASGTQPLFYQWRKNGAAVIGADSSRLALRDLAIGDSGDYTVKVWNSKDSAVSVKCHLHVDSMLYSITITKTNYGATPVVTIVKARRGTDKAVLFMPDPGYHIDSVKINAVKQSSAASSGAYTFKNVLADSSVSVFYSRNRVHLVLTSDSGTVNLSPSDTSSLLYGDTMRLTIGQPDAGFHFAGWGGDSLFGDSAVHSLKLVLVRDRRIFAQFIKNGSYMLTIVANNGTVRATPPNSTGYAAGQAVGLKALPDPGYSFASWSDSAAGSADSITIIMNSDKKVTAHFNQHTYKLYVAAQNGGRITVPASSPVQAAAGAQITITALPATDSGYDFSGWVIDSGTVGFGDQASAATWAKLTSGNAGIHAAFALRKYQLIISAGAGGSIRTPATSPVQVTHGTPSPLKAVAQPGYDFAGWTGPAAAIFGDASKDTTTVTITGAASVIATFAIKQFKLTVAATSGGSIVSPATSANPVTLNYGDSTLITAQANAGSGFYRWRSVKGMAQIRDTANISTWVKLTSGDDSVKAIFTSNSYTITVSPYDTNTGRIVVTPLKSGYGYNEAVTVVAHPAAGYFFSGWGSGIAGSDTTAALTMTKSYAISPVFTKIGSLGLSVSSPNGSVTISPDSTGSGGYHFGTSVTLTAQPNDSFTFVSWSGSGLSGNTNPKTITMDGSKTITANYVRKTWKLTIQTSGTGAGTVTPAGDTAVGHNVPITIQASRNAGSAFGGWAKVKGPGTVTFGNAGSPQTTVAIAGGNDTIAATFTKIKYKLSIVPPSNGSIVVTNPSSMPSDSMLDSNTAVTVKARPAAGYDFSAWSGVTAADSIAQFAMNSAKNISASFAIRQYTITFNSNGGSAISNQIVQYQGTVTRPVDPTMTGNDFAGWYTDVGLTNAYTFSAAVTGSFTLYAKWTLKTYTVTFNSNGGTGVASQSIQYQGTVTRPADPTMTGNDFGGWYSDQGLTSAYNFTTPVTYPFALYAKWTLKSYTISFNSNGGSAVSSQSIQYQGTVSRPTDPTKIGNDFVAWYTDVGLTNQYNFSTQVTGAFALYAKWNLQSYTVAFVPRGGSTVVSQFVNYNSTATAPTNCTKRSYVLAGWYTDSLFSTSAFSFSTPITGPITLYAKWEIRDADGNVYHEVTIGTQVWLIENLKTTHTNDGSAIPVTTDSTTWASNSIRMCCWYNDDMNNKADYGALYNYLAVNYGNLAPVGWHVSTDDDWIQLAAFIGDSAGLRLKEADTLHWLPPNKGATNSYGFTALPGGVRAGGNSYVGIRKYGVWWSPPSDLTAKTHAISGISLTTASPPPACSVRCVRDY